MKKQLTLAAAFLFIIVIAGITGCKKEEGENRPLGKKMAGKWEITKIETTVAGEDVDTYTGVSGDYIDFRMNENDELEISLAGDRYLGNYVTLVTNDFNLVLKGQIINCKASVITDTKFEFTGTVNGSNPVESRKYYLSK